MAASLWIYGGNQWADRYRLGSWPDLPVAVFGDRHGLDLQRPSYGCVIIEGRPSIVLRVLRQTPSATYPLTVLLETGGRLQERWKLNPAALIASILDCPELCRYLLDQPEDLQPARLEFLLDGLSDVTAGAVSEPTLEAMAAFFAGSCVYGYPPVAHPRDLLLPCLPDPRTMAALTSCVRVPLIFRNARGWLVGGSRAQASGFGATAVIDALTAPGGEEAISALAQGRAALEDLRDIIRKPDEALLAPWLSAPSWSGPNLCQLAVLGAKALREGPTAVLALLPSVPPKWQTAWLEYLLEALISQPGKLSASATGFLLEEAKRTEHRLSEAITARMEAGTLSSFLDERRYPPHAVEWLELPPGVLAERWGNYLEHAERALPGLLQQALTQVVAPADRQRLLETALDRSFRIGEGLDPWCEMARHPEFGTSVRLHAAEWLKSQLKNGRRPRAQQVEAFRDREIDDLLAGLTPRDATRYCQELLDEECVEAVRALASHQLRRRLSLNYKLRLAEVAGGDWRNILHVRQLVEGARSQRLAVPRERDFLCAEAHELVQGLQARGGRINAPNLLALHLWIGPLANETIAILRSLQPVFGDEEAARAWTEGWAELGEQAIHDRELFRFLLHRLRFGDPAGAGIRYVDFVPDTFAREVADLASRGPSIELQCLIELATQRPDFGPAVHAALGRGRIAEPPAEEHRGMFLSLKRMTSFFRPRNPGSIIPGREVSGVVTPVAAQPEPGPPQTTAGWLEAPMASASSVVLAQALAESPAELAQMIEGVGPKCRTRAFILLLEKRRETLLRALLQWLPAMLERSGSPAPVDAELGRFLLSRKGRPLLDEIENRTGRNLAMPLARKCPQPRRPKGNS